MSMRVLVVHASRYGSTQGIAERIAATLRQHGLEATVQSAEHAGDPADYAATVIGSAVYFGHWMKRATECVRRNGATLANRPVWLFSSGPLGTDAKDAQGRDLLVVSEPKEIAEFRTTIRPRDHRVFFGVLDQSKLGFTDGLVMKFAKHANAPFPDGDFRDWSDIEAWGNHIAQAVKASADPEHSSIPQSVSVAE
jgi:menaquinone-dependent protoporphyrinogen oxidase